MCLLYDGSTRRLTESGFMWFYGFMEKPGIEPATPGLQGIALIHYTTGASLLPKNLGLQCNHKNVNRTDIGILKQGLHFKNAVEINESW